MFIPALIATTFSAGLAFYILIKDCRALRHRIFAIGMIVLALEAASDSVSLTGPRIEVMLRWQYIKMAATAFLPGVWLVFTLMLENEDYKKSLTKWKGILLPLFIIPIMLLIFFNEPSAIKIITFSGISESSIFLSWPGKLFHTFLLLSSVFILVFLEKILRTTSGTMRWQIKFLILGIGAIFTMRVYTSSQALLYSIIDDSINILNSFAIIGGNTLIAISFIRTSKLSLTLYPSQGFLYNSLMLMIIGAYLIGVGLLAKLIHHFGYTGAIPLYSLFIFFAILFLAAFILSEKVRQKIKEFISRNLLRHHYDYREQWREFTRRTSSILDIKELSYVISKMIAGTLGVSTASVWLFDENKGSFILGGSTAYSSKEKHFLKLPEKQSSNFSLEIKNHAYLIDFQKPKELWQEELKKANNYYFQGNRIRYAIPLISNENILGLITVNEKVTKREFSIEDFDLLRTISEQVASTLLNFKLSEQIRNFKEMEAFRTMSAFIMHDLKNLASSLSLTIQNLPVLYDNPEFRQDAVRISQQSLEKINNICAGLSALSQKIEIKKVKTNLDELIINTLATLNISASSLLYQADIINSPSAFVQKEKREKNLSADLHRYIWPLSNGAEISVIYNPQLKTNIMIDAEQIQKVLINLLLNARDASNEGGEIRIGAKKPDGWIEIYVSDKGCGMSKEFIENSLFKPFKTTKKKGMGIGLFQSKMIIEAHGGRIEVESQENLGTTFRIYLLS